ncbi:hypothetical protein BASA81_016246 [Batrachochytrium salamandrivorans]|nr:hypothetical protein BASA81_016246 [Batrachochytrium salamandrivorans]
MLPSMGSKELRDVCVGNSRRLERLTLEHGLVHELERRLPDSDKYVWETVCALFACNKMLSQSARRQVLESSLVDVCVSSSFFNKTRLLQSMLEFSSELACRIPLSNVVVGTDKYKALYASSLVWERKMTWEQERFLLEDTDLNGVPAVTWFRVSKGLIVPPFRSPRSSFNTTDLASAIWRLALGRIQPGENEVPPLIPFQPLVEDQDRLLEWVASRNNDNVHKEPVDDELLLQCHVGDFNNNHEVCVALAVLACTGNASNTVMALLPTIILPSLAAGDATALACLIAGTRHSKRVARQVLTWWTTTPPTLLYTVEEKKDEHKERALVYLMSNLASHAPEAIYQLAELDHVIDLLLAHCKCSNALTALTAMTACPLALGRLVACSELTDICRRATASPSTPLPQEWHLLNAMAFYLSMNEEHKQVLLCRRDLFWERLVCGNGLRFWTNLLVGGGTGFVDPRHVLAVLTMVASSQEAENIHLEFLANLAYNSDLDQFKQRMLNDLRVVARIQRALACPHTAVIGLRVVANLAKGKSDPGKMDKIRALFPLTGTPAAIAVDAAAAVSDILS